MSTFKKSVKQHVFEDLNPGKFYISVLNNELDVIEQDVVVIIPKIEVLSTSYLEKECDLLVSGFLC
jgi:hypothetical protein